MLSIIKMEAWVNMERRQLLRPPFLAHVQAFLYFIYNLSRTSLGYDIHTNRVREMSGNRGLE